MAEYESLWNDFLNENAEDDTAVQDRIKKGYPARKSAILTGGKKPVKTGKPFNIDPPKSRSKSAPPGAGVLEEESLDESSGMAAGSIVGSAGNRNVFGLSDEEMGRKP